MVKLVLRILILMFLMESSWAAAAQYCRHELGLNVQHFGHHSHQHKNGDGNTTSVDQTILKSDKQSGTDSDTDCPFCHLGAMKSILPMVTIAPTVSISPILEEVSLIYPHIALPQPERPNWLLAA